jgi:hypothetical protein
VGPTSSLDVMVKRDPQNTNKIAISEFLMAETSYTCRGHLDICFSPYFLHIVFMQTETHVQNCFSCNKLCKLCPLL